MPTIDQTLTKCRHFCAKNDNLWQQIQALIIENAACMNDRFTFARICHHIAQTDPEKVEIRPEFLKIVLGYFREQMHQKPELFNEKDLNNVIAMLQAGNVRHCFNELAVGEAEAAAVWGMLLEELVEQERIHSFNGADLAILCKLIS